MNWRNACRKLQDKGIKFENVSVNGKIWYKGPWEFKNDPKDYRIPAQSIPDIPDWRDLCMKLQELGVSFELDTESAKFGWLRTKCDFTLNNVIFYRIPAQTIPDVNIIAVHHHEVNVDD